VSALTQLTVDAHERIFTSDSRLLRRIVRDRLFRGYHAERTIEMWPSVRRGETRHIFPFQEQSDAIFNSALVYEPAVLKIYAERFLLEVPTQSPSFPEADRLLRFLALFVPVFAEALFGGGMAALREAKFSEAIGHLVEYIRLKPTDPQGYLNVGKAYLGTGAFGDALAAFVRGLAQGGDPTVRQELIRALWDGGLQALTRGDPRSAIGFLSEYVRHDPRNFSAYLNLGKAYWQAGDRFQALSAFRRVLELSPGHGEALQFLQGVR